MIDETKHSEQKRPFDVRIEEMTALLAEQKSLIEALESSLGPVLVGLPHVTPSPAPDDLGMAPVCQRLSNLSYQIRAANETITCLMRRVDV